MFLSYYYCRENEEHQNGCQMKVEITLKFYFLTIRMTHVKVRDEETGDVFEPK